MQWEPCVLHQPLPSLPQFPWHEQQSRTGPHTRHCMGTGIPRAGQSFGTGIPHAPGADGHRDAPCRVLMGMGVPHAGHFLGHRDPTQTKRFMGTELPSGGHLQAQGSPRLGTSWAQGSLLPGALRAQESPHAGQGGGAVRTQGHTHPPPPRSVRTHGSQQIRLRRTLYSRSQQISSSQALQGPTGAGLWGAGCHSATLGGGTRGGAKDMPGSLACICTV